jgi:hypothetical protein
MHVTYINMEMETEQIMAFQLLFEKMVMAMLDAHHTTIMACLGQTEANTEKTVLGPEMMQSVEAHQEIPRENAVAKSVKGSDPRKLWIPEEVGCHLQEGVPPCNSGMAKKETLRKSEAQKNVGLRKEITAAGMRKSLEGNNGIREQGSKQQLRLRKETTTSNGIRG